MTDQLRFEMGKNTTERQQLREYRTVKHLVDALSNICCASPEMTIDRLTGYLWTEEEAAEIKKANQGN